MRVAVILGLLAVGFCAPVVDQQAAVDDVSENELRVKRAKEEMMFGNQQNGAKEMAKRVDPSMDNLVDSEGEVYAKPPVNIENQEAESIESNEEGFSNEAPIGDEFADDGENGNGEMNEDLPGPDEAGGDGRYGVEEESTALGPVGEESEEDGLDAYQNYQDLFNDDKMKIANTAYMFSKLLSEPQPYPPYQKFGDLYDSYPNYRFRRSQLGRFIGAPGVRTNSLKRSHRTKRDLYYPLDALSNEYYPYEDSYIPYKNYPVDNYDINEMIESLEGPRLYEEEDDDKLNYVNPYDGYYGSPYEGYEQEVENGPWFTAPLKRQVGPSYVPGIKRSRDFYPSFREPWTHYQAFIPEKRALEDYGDAYQRVMELAAALRRQKSYYPEEYTYEDFLRRRK
ncbi:uncharacterized protein LOC128238697 [Mya arenaria]|nr:uncharacterized protein LOC128238697 [Mya arenaria]